MQSHLLTLRCCRRRWRCRCPPPLLLANVCIVLSPPIGRSTWTSSRTNSSSTHRRSPHLTSILTTPSTRRYTRSSPSLVKNCSSSYNILYYNPYMYLYVHTHTCRKYTFRLLPLLTRAAKPPWGVTSSRVAIVYSYWYRKTFPDR